MRSTLVLFASLAFTAASPLAAQDFAPPEEGPPSSIKFGIFGFSSRWGVDFKNVNQMIASIALDVGDIYSDRVRVRPSFEIGVGGAPDTYVGSLELQYRFTPDAERAVPYLAFGLGVYGQPGCAAAPACPKIWPQFALGFELKFRGNMNWLLEYHGEDSLNRHRFFIGLATRRS